MKWTVITGACGGLGKAFCNEYASLGCALVIQSRSQKKLDELKKQLIDTYHVEVETILCDFEQNQDVLSFCDQLKSFEIERCICNAGFGSYGAFDMSDIQQMMAMHKVNMDALMLLNHAMLTEHKNTLKEILNVASTAAFQPGPWMSVYYATKAYVLSFSQAVSAEMKDVKVSVLCCGPMETGFSKRAQLNHTWMQKLVMLTPEKAARCAVEGLTQGRRCIIPGVLNQLIVKANSLLPMSVQLQLMRFIQSKRQKNKKSRAFFL